MSDEVVTHAEVLRWLPARVRHDLEMAMPPEQRGWFTEAEVQQYDGDFVEIADLRHRERRYLAGRTTPVLRVPFLPTIGDAIAPTRAEITAGIRP